MCVCVSPSYSGHNASCCKPEPQLPTPTPQTPTPQTPTPNPNPQNPNPQTPTPGTPTVVVLKPETRKPKRHAVLHRWPGTISVVERVGGDGDKPQMYIIDGQHRLGLHASTRARTHIHTHTHILHTLTHTHIAYTQREIAHTQAEDAYDGSRAPTRFRAWGLRLGIRATGLGFRIWVWGLGSQVSVCRLPTVAA